MARTSVVACIPEAANGIPPKVTTMKRAGPLLPLAAFVLGVAVHGGAACDSADLESDGDSDLGEPPPLPDVDEAVGCDGADLLARPTDLTSRGPWPVGTRRITVDRLTVDVFYPAQRGSDFGRAAAVFDIRTFLPASQQDFVSDERNPAQVCDCFADLPLDDVHGPWPVVVFVHGTAAFSTQSLSDLTHWASRGVVVVAATHPGLYLADSLALFCPDDPTGPRDLDGDVDALLAAVGGGGAGLGFLSGALSDRVALVGHSAGANTVVAAGNRVEASADVDVVVSLAGSAALERAGVAFLAMAGTADSVVRASASVEAWGSSSTPRRLVTLTNAGHLAFSDLCETRNDAGENLLVIAQDERICGADAASFLFDCSPDLQPAAESRAIVRAATTWVFEEHLLCAPPPGSFADDVGALPGVEEVSEVLE
jgi:alpha-beta hydrolase superfamily lysophospholipase